MLVAELLSAIRGKRQQKFQTTIEQYEAMLSALAAGEQVDVDVVESLLDQLDKSDADLQREVEAKQRRLSAAANLTRLRKSQAAIPALAAKVKRLDDELTQIIAEKRPAIAEAADKLRDAEREVSFIANEESVLRTVGIPLGLIARQEKVQRMVNELRPKREQFEEYTRAERKRLPYARQKLELARQDLAKLTSAHGAGALRDAQAEVDSAAADIEQLEQELQKYEPQRKEIEQLQAQIDSEGQAISRELMEP